MSYPLSLSFYGFRPPSRPVGGLVLISSCYLSLELLPVRTWLFAHAIVRVPLAVTQQDRMPACWPISSHSSFCNIAIKSWTVGYDKSLSLHTHRQMFLTSSPTRRLAPVFLLLPWTLWPAWHKALQKKKSLCFIVGRKCCPNTSWRGPHLIHSATFDVWCLMAPGHPSDPLLQWMVMKDSVGKLAVRIACLLCVKAKNDHDSVLAFIGFRGMQKKKKRGVMSASVSTTAPHNTCLLDYGKTQNCSQQESGWYVGR